MDTYISTLATSPARIGFAISTLAWWARQPLANVRIYDFGADPRVFSFSKGFSVTVARSSKSDRLRRVMAENDAQTDVYILADDDCLPLEQGFIERGLVVMGRNRDFGMLCAFPVTPETIYTLDTLPEGEAFDFGCVGGIRFIRKGALRVFPDTGNWRGYDGEHCEAMRKAGLRVGYMRDVRMNHLGFQNGSAAYGTR